MLKVGALCAGYGGLELGLELAGVPTELTWYAENDPHAAKVMQHNYGHAPNLGDLTKIQSPPSVDIVAAGFPCQPVSVAGHREGVNDERWLIEDVVRVWKESGAGVLILENVPGLRTANNGQAFEQVLAALASVGSIARWNHLRASDVGAPHQRERWFCVAYADSETRQLQTTAGGATAEQLTAVYGGDLYRRFGKFGPAIHRWETILGLQSPRTKTDGRLNPAFVEWMMGLPEGHVTNVPGLSRNQMLRILGNGVVPQQAAEAYRRLA